MDASAHAAPRRPPPQAADDGVVLGDDDQATRPASFAEDCLGIERLDRRNMQHRDIHMVIGKSLGASSARMVRRPEEMIRTSLPSRISFAFPSSNL